MFLDIVRFLLSGVCHQLPEHALVMGGQALPLCARCTGTFLGVIVGLLALWGGRGRRSGMPQGRVWWVLALPLAAWALDGLNAFVGDILGRPWLYAPQNVLRLVTGTGFGLSIATLLYPTAYYALGWEARGEPVLARFRDAAVLPVAGVVLVAVLLLAPAAPYAVWSALLVGATVGVLALVNGALVILALNKEGRAGTWSRAALYAAAGLAAALAEMGALALVRRLILG